MIKAPTTSQLSEEAIGSKFFIALIKIYYSGLDNLLASFAHGGVNVSRVRQNTIIGLFDKT